MAPLEPSRGAGRGGANGETCRDSVTGCSANGAIGPAPSTRSPEDCADGSATVTIAAYFAGLRTRGRSLRFRLVALVAAALVPALAFDGWLTMQAARSERTQLERNADDKIKEVMADIDHEIASSKATLIALASSQFLQTQDFERFHRQMTEVARQLGVQIVLRDAPSGRQLVNTIVNWGEEPPQLSPPESINSMREALESGKASISNVYNGTLTGRSLITVGIPVARGGANAYYLQVAIPLDTFAAALSNAGL